MNKKNEESKPYGWISDSLSLYHGECLEVMDYLVSLGVKVDAIICDPPYG